VRQLDDHFPLRIDGGNLVQVRVVVPPDRAFQRERWIEGVRWAIFHHARMIGRPPATALTVVADTGGANAAARDEPGTIRVPAPFLASARGMAIEAAIARAVGRAFWQSAVRCDDEDGAIVEGLVRYTATMATIAQYGPLRAPAVTGFYEQRWLGGLMPWVIRFEVPAWRSLSADSPDAAARTAIAMESLARWIGPPTLEAAFRALTAARRDGCISWRDLQQAADDVSGLDLGWFFDPVFGVPRLFDYGVEAITSEHASSDARAFHTRVVIRRYGDGIFTGSADRPGGAFEAGRGVELRVRFADGSERTDYWDGRAERRTFEYDEPAAAESAVVDPRSVILLDANRTNNSVTLKPRTREASAAWSIRWLVWLQDLLLAYSALV
jgi:hypothetical protein